MQAAVGTLFSFVFALVYATNKPWLKASVNKMTLIFSVGIFLFFFSALLLKMEIANDTSTLNALILTLFVISLMMPAVPLFYTFSHDQ